MTVLFPDRYPTQSQRVDALFAEHRVAQQRVSQVAGDVMRAVDEQRARLETERGRIRQRIERGMEQHTQPPTSEVNRRINDIVASVVAEQRGER